MAFKILSKKNGKRTVSDDKGDDTLEEDEALRVELCDIPAVSEDVDNDTTGNTTSTNDEKGATGGIKTILTNMNEDNSESNKKVRVANDNPLDDTSDSISSIADDDNEMRSGD